MTETRFVPNQDTLNGCFCPHPALTQEAAAFSHTLSAAAYRMQTQDFQQHGWTDFSYQVDHTLLTGRKMNHTGGVNGRISRFFTRIARHRVRRSDPISQLYGTWRQKDKSDTCKALVMARSMDDGHILIAIGFMGTGKRLFDWISNLRISREDHAHRGFAQLTDEFLSRAEDIRFPHTAKQLGEDKLTLDAILEECTRPDSRFRIWISGHSQGGAVMQLFTHRLMASGVLPQNLFGVGFASPTTVYPGHTGISTEYPLHHLICGDDLTPRIGAELHLGTCHVLPMNRALREQSYLCAGLPGFMPVLYMVSSLRDTRCTLLFSMGLLSALSHLSDQDAGAVLIGLTDLNVPDLLVDWLGDNVSRMVLAIYRKLKKTYRRVTGEWGVPRDEVRLYTDWILDQMRIHTPRGFAQLLALALSAPHHLSGRENLPSAYQRMTEDCFPLLRPMVALPGSWPVTVPLRHPARKKPIGKYRRFSTIRRSRHAL